MYAYKFVTQTPSDISRTTQGYQIKSDQSKCHGSNHCYSSSKSIFFFLLFLLPLLLGSCQDTTESLQWCVESGWREWEFEVSEKFCFSNSERERERESRQSSPLCFYANHIKSHPDIIWCRCYWNAPLALSIPLLLSQSANQIRIHAPVLP